MQAARLNPPRFLSFLRTLENLTWTFTQRAPASVLKNDNAGTEFHAAFPFCTKKYRKKLPQ
ncbi:hypothetical protein D881_11815 [Corynebacterium ulcerans NCTC 12077]|nr:hypothetical protein D881_11815 [Corynebacterium ulcerans NCTC 12077]